MGVHAKALPLLEQALAIGRARVRIAAASASRRASTISACSSASWATSAAAEPLLVESLATRRRLLGNEDKDVAVTLVELARVLKDRGRGPESEAPTREALAIRQKIFGDEHRETATSKNELALLLLGARRSGRRRAALSRERGDERTRAGRRSSERRRRQSRASRQLLIAKGDAAGAEALLRESLAVDGRVFGDDAY